MPNYTMQTRRFNLSGFLLLAAGMATLTLALDGQKGLGISPAWLAGLVAVGLCALLLYLWHARGNARALFSLNLFRNRTFSRPRRQLRGTHRQRHAAVYDPGVSADRPRLLPLSRRADDDPDGARQHGHEADRGPGGQPLWLPSGAGRRHPGLAAVSLLFMFSALAGWYYALPLVLFLQGMINASRFSSMNTLTLKNLPDDLASSGNSLLSMVMQLSMSIGVTIAGLLLGLYGQQHMSLDAASTHQVFLYTYLSMAAIIALPALIFSRVPDDVGSNTVLRRRNRSGS